MPHKVLASGFAAIPYKLMDQGDYRIWSVYAVLHRHGWNSHQGCWVSINTIQLESGMSRKVVQRALAWLKETGWIEAKARSGHTTVFHVKTDAPEPIAKTTQVKNDLGRKRPTPQVENDLPPRSKTTYEQEPINKNPGTKTQKAQAPPKDPNRTKKLPLASIPFELDDCADLLVEFWAVKKGTRSSSVLKRITNKLLQWPSEARRSALERSIASGWGDVFEPRAKASHGASQEPLTKHPASRIFTADQGFIDEPCQNPVLQNLFDESA